MIHVMSSKFRMLQVHVSCVCHRKVVVTLPNTVESTCRSNFLQIVTFAYDVAWNVSLFLLQRFVCARASSSSRLSNTCSKRSGGTTQSTAHPCIRRSISRTVSTNCTDDCSHWCVVAFIVLCSWSCVAFLSTFSYCRLPL